MVGAIAYLAAASVRNRARRQLRRLRSPRYVVALLAGVAYVFWFLLRPAQQGGAAAVLGDEGVARVAALGFALLVAKWWVAGADPRALAFTPAEIHLLFPAPVSRRALVATKLARAQLIILVNTVIWAVILRGEGLHLASWRRALGLWVLFSTLHLHRLGAALSTASLARHGAAGRRRQAIPVLLVAAAAVAIVWTFVRGAPDLARAWAFGPAPTLHTIARLLEGTARGTCSRRSACSSPPRSRRRWTRGCARSAPR
jgi:ABC-2 type transport system permease protein